MPNNWRWAGGVVFLVGGALWLSYPRLEPPLLAWLAQMVSADQSVSASGVRQVSAMFHLASFALCLTGLVLWGLRNRAGWGRLCQIALEQPESTKRPLHIRPQMMALISTGLGVGLILHIRYWERQPTIFARLYHEDGLFEVLTVCALVLAAAGLALSAWRYRSAARPREIPRWVPTFYLMLALALLFWAGEEFSWGQRLGGWATPHWFTPYNAQNETNVHNLFNRLPNGIYIVLALVPLPSMVGVVLRYGQRGPVWTAKILPPPSLLGLGGLIAIVAIVQPIEEELLEEMLALYFAVYTLWVYGQSPAPRLSASTA